MARESNPGPGACSAEPCQLSYTLGSYFLNFKTLLLHYQNLLNWGLGLVEFFFSLSIFSRMFIPEENEL